ncbi:chemotaxis response regulator protein-glutamate methylesterase [Paenibacillus sp. FSL H8-0537]|uniref:protein-glutamate methylesterase/protein-glutamine glutaminase n=1 Tax=Paenibacillus sp. FSL H8-0537 TaxID=2921399 RepID=UPI003100AAFC
MHRILVVDDSSFMRHLIKRYIEEDPKLKVVGEARNGEEAIAEALRLRPDVITMDVEMPGMDGLTALSEIMRRVPTPVIILSSLHKFGGEETIMALQRGAVDFVAKPSGELSADIYKVKSELCEKIKNAAGAPIQRLLKLAGVPQALPTPHPQLRKTTLAASIVRELIAIGSSTGGPQALTVLLKSLPAAFEHPIVIVQHMPATFTASLAQRLDGVSAVKVVEAKDKQQLVNGTVFIAPGDSHMNVEEKDGSYFIKLHQKPLAGLHRPSVDELFRSVAELKRLKRHLVLLTGMGSDGAEQMLQARKAGQAATTIAEAKETCIVYGMPKAAVDRGAVDYVLPIEQIGRKLLDVTKGKI